MTKTKQIEILEFSDKCKPNSAKTFAIPGKPLFTA